MPIYRLNASGVFQKLGRIARLNASGVFQSLGVIYRLNGSGIFQKIFPSGPDTPTQLTDPGNPSGTGEAFTSVTKGAAGTYSNYNTGYGVVTTLIKIPIENSPVSATETQYGDVLSSPYTVTQADATTPVYKYYTQSSVKNVAGTKTFYFYSSGYVQAYVGNITDSYSRTVASGLGTSSSSYIYSSYANLTSSWSVNGTRGVNSTAVSSGAVASSHPLQTIELGSSDSSKTDKTYSVDLPDGKGGQGVAFWTTDADSWYAVTSSFDYDTSTTTIVNCSATGTWTSPTTSSVTDCNNANPFSSTLVDYRCGTCVYSGVTYPCGGTSTYSSTTSGTSPTQCESVYPLGSLAGDRCGPCTYTGSSTSLLCTGTGSYTNPTSSSTANCESANPIVFTNGGRCGSCSYTGVSYPCTGTGTYSNTSGTSTTPCETANPIGSLAGERCGSCTYTGSTSVTTYPCTGSTSGQASCPGTGSGPGDRCGACTASTSYPCTGSVSGSFSCPSTGPLAGDRCGACTSTTTDTFGLCRTIPNTPVCPSCPNGTTSIAQYNCATGSQQCRCRTITYSYAIRQTSTTYSYPIRQTLVTTTYNFSYPIRTTQYNFTFPAYQNVTTYSFSYPIRTTQYNFTFPKNQNEVVTQYTYNTRLKIWSAVSGTVTSQAWDNFGNSTGFITSQTNTVTFDPSLFIGVYSITATTNGNTVTAVAYNSGGTQMGSTLTKTFTSPVKAAANNETSAGVIKAYSPNNVGTLYDNLSIT